MRDPAEIRNKMKSICSGGLHFPVRGIGIYKIKYGKWRIGQSSQVRKGVGI